MSRFAFTLIELLVTIAIIGILVGITLPAVMMVRESANRTQCSNNVRQIAIALQSYHSTNRAFPLAVATLTKNSDHGPLVELLGFLEQSGLARSMDLPVQHLLAPPFLDGPDVFTCPSDKGKGLNYRACIGSEPYAWEISGSNIGGNGIFNSRSKVSAKNVTDGLSHTVTFAERKLGNGNGVAGEDLWIAGYYSHSFDPLSAIELRKNYSINCPKSSLFEYCGHDWRPAGLTYSWYNHVYSPGTRNCDLLLDSVVSIVPPLGGAVTPSSKHSGGTVNCCYGDGSVRSVGPQVDETLWIASGTIDSSEK